MTIHLEPEDEQLIQKRGATAFEQSDLPPINYVTLAEIRRRLGQQPIGRDAHAIHAG